MTDNETISCGVPAWHGIPMRDDSAALTNEAP